MSSFSRFRNMKIRKANQAAEYPCINVVNGVSQAAGELNESMQRLEKLGKMCKRVEDEMNCLERDKHIRLADFKKKMAEQEIITVQRTLMKYQMTQIDQDEYKTLLSAGKRPTQAQVKENDEKLGKEVTELESSELHLSSLTNQASITQLESGNTQLKQEVELLRKTVEGLQKELDSQKKLTLEITLNAIHNEEEKRERERAKRQKLVY